KSRRLAGGQPDVEQHACKLSRDPAVPPQLDAEVPPACRCCRSNKARASFEVTGGVALIPRRDQQGVSRGIGLMSASLTRVRLIPARTPLLDRKHLLCTAGLTFEGLQLIRGLDRMRLEARKVHRPTAVA